MSASGRVSDDEVSDSDEFVTSLDALIKVNPEMVVVASPATFHMAHAMPLIKAGIPILIEKPVTADVQDSECLQNVIKQNVTPVAVGYCLRYLSSSQEMKVLIEQGFLGEIYNVFIQVGQYLPDWRPDKDYRDSVSANRYLGGGALLELSHELDYAQWLLGELSVEHSILRSSNTLGLEVEDMVDVMLTSAQGIVCNIHLDFLQRSVQRTCSLIGEKGRLEWDLIKNTITFYHRKGNDVLYSEPAWDKNNMYIAMLHDFKAMIERKKHHCIEFEEAEKTIQLIESIKAKASWSN
jgi:hypothetical protein